MQIVFADTAHIKLSGTLTIPCGRSATTNGPLIALYGLKTDIAGRARTNYTLRPTGRDRQRPMPRPSHRSAATITTAGTELPAGRHDHANARARTSDHVASLVATGLNVKPGYPAGVPVTLRIAHRRGQQQGICEPRLVKAADGTTCTVPLTRQPTMHDRDQAGELRRLQPAGPASTVT